MCRAAKANAHARTNTVPILHWARPAVHRSAPLEISHSPSDATATIEGETLLHVIETLVTIRAHLLEQNSAQRETCVVASMACHEKDAPATFGIR